MKWKKITLALLAVCLAVAVVFRPDNSSKKVLADGTVLILSGVKIGPTNSYSHGTFLSRTIGRLVPPRGIRVGDFGLGRPQIQTLTGVPGAEILSAQLQLLPGSPRQTSFISPPFFRCYRWLIYGDNGVTFVKEFSDFKNEADGLFSKVWGESFPRDSKHLHFRLEERDQPTGRAWREVATFVVKNPKPAHPEPWKIENSPRFKLADDLELQIGDLTVRSAPIHPDDIWEQTAFLQARIIDHGQVRTNWGISGYVWDATGNEDALPEMKMIANDWIVYKTFRPLDPTKPWRFKVSFALDSDFPETNLFHVEAESGNDASKTSAFLASIFSEPKQVASYIPPVKRASILTNLGGFPAAIGYVNNNAWTVELTTKPSGIRLTFVKAVDGDGNDLPEAGSSWGQYSFMRCLREPRDHIYATVAIHRNYSVEFTIQPHDETKHFNGFGGSSP